MVVDITPGMEMLKEATFGTIVLGTIYTMGNDALKVVRGTYAEEFVLWLMKVATLFITCTAIIDFLKLVTIYMLYYGG